MKISAASYKEYRDSLFKDTRKDPRLLYAYRATLRSRIARWQAWVDVMVALKYSVVAAAMGALVGLLPAIWRGTFGHYTPHLLSLNGLANISYLIEAIAIVIVFGYVLSAWSPSRVVLKIEKATFVLAIVEDIISDPIVVLSERDSILAEYHASFFKRVNSNVEQRIQDRW